MIDTEHDDEQPEPRTPRKRAPGLAGLAILVAIAALALAAWSIWRLHRFAQDELAARRHDAAIIATLQSQLAAGDEQARAGDHRIGKLESGLDDLRVATQGLDRRIGNLETAYTNLSGQQQSAQDTVLLNDAEMLLRTGVQRYDLFHDSTGALKAYSQAVEVLAQVQDPAYAPVRASAMTERDALAAAAPPSRQAALDTLSALRGRVASLPMASADAAAESSAPPQKPGFWSRVGSALGGIVKVSRDNEAAVPLTDTRFARQTLAVDLVQAQEALLAFDDATYRAALQRADAALAAQFDGNDAGVKDARAQITNLLLQHGGGPAPRLGGALAQLQSLRASHPAAPAPASTAGSAKR
ncbi:MAG TPA: uroporphyrinogen-III C-methyltransferase [Rhodanobacteraceae bacterium]|jgi:uroporphyrin-3 C-methyltransferase|nr:uroporphyrinogen-III C-methyltransferase [Rhodanobacteraceae bacterium]